MRAQQPIRSPFVLSAVLCLLAGTLFWSGPLVAQTTQGEEGYPIARQGYDELPFFEGEVVVTTRNGPKRLRITISKLQIQSGQEEAAKIPLPAAGVAFFQHRAGELEATLDGERFEPFEGEWIVVDPPAELVFEAGDDSVLVDAVTVSEEP